VARIVSVNISKGGVPKFPVAEARVTSLGLLGDAVRNTLIHGGPHQALLLVAKESIDALALEGFPVYAGALGENLTIEDLDFTQLAPGVRLRAGGAILEITKPRQPCATLDVYNTGDVTIQARLTATPGSAGFYVRVLQTGLIRQHDIIELLEQAV
jgi:MOSC domain-containing protein YiiM